MTWFPFLLWGDALKGSGCPSLGPQPSEKQGTRAYLRIPALDPASTAKAVWKMEVDQSSSVSTGVVQLMVTPPADAPVGAYSLTAEHRGESAPLGRLVLLFNPWCPGRSLVHRTFEDGGEGGGGDVCPAPKIHVTASTEALVWTPSTSVWRRVHNQTEHTENMDTDQGTNSSTSAQTLCPMDRNMRTRVSSTTVGCCYSQSRPAGPGGGAESSMGTWTQFPTQKLVQKKQKDISCYSGGALWSEIPPEVGHLGQCGVKILMDMCLCSHLS